MSDPTLGPVDLEQIEEDERREKIRNRVIMGLILLIGLAVAFWVGSLVSANQETASKAEQQTVVAEKGQEQAQVEKFNLAQQIAEACANPDNGLDEQTAERLCRDAATIVREGPQGAQGIPGVQGAQGIQGLTGAQGVRGPPGVDGIDGTNGVDGAPGATGEQGPAGEQGPQGETGAQGPEGPAGEPGAVGPMGPQGEDGEPPVAWVVYGPGEQVIERCERVADFDRDAPEYTCTRL